MFCVKRLRNLSVEDPREYVVSVEGVILPAIWSLSVGVVTPPIPTLPLERIVKNDSPDEDATLNGLRTVDDELCTLNANVDDVALTPATVPLSRRLEVASVFADVQRAINPLTPPARIPSGVPK